MTSIRRNPITGWFTEDFTLRELKTLRAKERLPLVRPNNTKYDGKFQIPTFDEVLDLVEHASMKAHRTIGVCRRPSTRRTSTRSGSPSRRGWSGS